MNKVILFALFAITISALRFPIIQPRIPIPVHNHSVEVEDFKLPPITITIGKELEVEQFGFKDIGKIADTVGKVAGIVGDISSRTFGGKYEVEDLKLPPHIIPFIPPRDEVEDLRLPRNRTNNHTSNRNNTKKNESEVEDFKLPPITITIGKELEIEDLRLPTHNRFNISRFNHTQNKTHNHNKTHNRTHNKTHNHTHNKSYIGNKSRKNQTEVEDFKLPPITITIGKELEVEQFGLKAIGKIADTVGKVAGVGSSISRTFGGKHELEAVNDDSNVEFLSF